MEHINSQTLTKRLTLSVVAACLISFCGLITETAVNIAFPKIMATFFCLVLGFCKHCIYSRTSCFRGSTACIGSDMLVFLCTTLCESRTATCKNFRFSKYSI